MKTFDDLQFVPDPVLGSGGRYAYAFFPNGLGVSVIQTETMQR